MFRPCWVIFRKNFCCGYTTVALYSWAFDCVLRCLWRRELSVVSACTAAVQNHKKKFSLKMTQQGRNM
jgi:hypothetical protein